MNQPLSLRLRAGILLAFALLLAGISLAQPSQQLIQQYLNEKRVSLGLTTSDVQHWTVSDQYQNPKTGAWHLYLQQTLNEVPIWGAISSCVVRSNAVVVFNSRFVPQAAEMANTAPQTVAAAGAVEAALLHLGIAKEALRELPQEKPGETLFENALLSARPIAVRPVWVLAGDQLEPAWNVNIQPLDQKNWWNIRINRTNGQFIAKNNWVQHCAFGHNAFGHLHLCSDAPAPAALMPATTGATYRVFPFPIESPNHGSRQLLTDPADNLASPFGWHDTNAVAGPEFLITRGNNVYAYEDRDDNDLPGYSPSGGANLTFDFPLDLTQAPLVYQDAAITNLFYVNNVMHDLWQQYGFDEAAGNFQAKNYSGQGDENDWVEAQAQDGGGINNANMATPPDGQNPQMQMYLWGNGGGGTTQELTVNSPSGIAGNYAIMTAGFGPGITAPITADLVIVTDGTPNGSLGCNALTNAAALAGKIAVVDRGSCTFVSKVQNAQNAGAIAVIVVNNQAGLMAMSGSSAGITIPAVMISQTDGAAIKSVLVGGLTVNGTLNPSGGGSSSDLDGDLDNGIIAHEYTHGISNRLTGGPSNVDCLDNTEQMGEGWSDYMAVVMTIRPGDTKNTSRGMGTYAFGEPTTGVGIRDYPYTYNMSVNPFTYADIQNVSVPHGVGSVWCTMLWDMTWMLIDSLGYDTDLYYGTGGNNIAMSLVTQGMALQACNPGFVDGRNAILQADDLLYGGVHKCLIWEAFARRGLGYSASQGSTDVVGDETEAFDLPPICQVATIAPTANFAASTTETCFGQVKFSDLSVNTPQAWYWDFGDGTTSTLQNPTHTYSNGGSYTVTLVVSNPLGADTLEAQNYIFISKPLPPVVANATILNGTSASLSTAPSAGGVIHWYDSSATTLLASGNNFQTPVFSSLGLYTYQVREEKAAPSGLAGPGDNSIGSGSYHSSSFIGKLLFTADQPFTLISAWVDASGAGNRDINLWDAQGSLLQTLTVNIPDGQSRIALNLQIPAAGQYTIGGSNVDLYRNTSGAQYPYTLPGIVSITGSNATTNPQGYYYYLYDWEVQPLACIGDWATASVLVVTEVSTDPASSSSLAVMPNPAHSHVSVQVSGVSQASYQFVLLNAAGQVVRVQQSPDATAVFATADLAPGIYAVQVVAGDSLLTRKVVIE